MRRLRLLLARHPALVAWLVLCALGMRLLVPAGFMPAVGSGGVALVACSGMTVAAPTAMAHHSGGHHDDGSDGPAPTKPEAPCAFAGPGLGAPGPVGTAIVLAALALAMLLAAGFATTLPARAPVRWRPPLRAPPASA